MFYRIKKRYLLRGWERLPYALVDRHTKRTSFIRRDEFDLLSLCDGTTDLSLPLIPSKMREMVPLLEKEGIIEPCSNGERLNPEQMYRLYPSRYIKTAHWSITGRCNYRCKHCYMSAPDAKMGELSHEKIMSIIDQLEECGIMNVSLTGGEPLVRKDFLEIVDALLQRGIRITTIYSNGKLVTDKLLDELEQRGIHPEFNMSFDGIGHHDWLRGIPGAEEIVKEAFLRCKERGFPTAAELCIHKDNKHTLRESVNLLASWGCHHLKTNPVSNVGAWKEGGYGESITKQDLYQLYLDYIPQYYADGMPLSIQLGGFFMAWRGEPERYAIPSQKNCQTPETMCICGHARQVMYISPEGRALPCMALSGMDIQKEFPLIGEVGLQKCLTDSRYLKLIDTRASEYFAHNPDCATCKYARECVGGCRASALEGNPDDILGPDLFACEIFRGGWVPKIMEAIKMGRQQHLQNKGNEKNGGN